MKKSILTLSLIVAAVMVQAAPFTFKNSDANGDGAITMEEWVVARKAAFPKGKAADQGKWFKNWDKDGNGKITQKEFDTRKKQQAAANAKKKGQAQAKGKKK